ncbi:MAG: transport permease protein [Planctomycetota bacterium]|nr:MAG: transport permease protein [Planctomycetota bacterium]
MSTLAGLHRDLTRHRELTLGLVRRELFSPFAGSAFGVAWALLHPLLLMGVYLLVFTFVFTGGRFGGGSAGLDYQSFMLSGMVAWMGWSALLGSACNAVTGSASLVKQADFPTEVLPLRTVFGVLVPHLVGLVVVMAWVLLRFQIVPWTWALLPLAVLIQSVGMLAVAYLLGALCVFVRDVKEVVTVFTAVGIFLAPVFYTPATEQGLPAVLRWAVLLNPFSHFVHMYRDCLFSGAIEHPVSWAVCVGLAVPGCLLGRRAFDRLKLFFGNFL